MRELSRAGALPTFFVIGAAKAGTTSMHHYLGLHPQIQMSGVKEPGYFAGPENGRPYPSGRISDLKEYEALFDPSFATRGEASPNYTFAPVRSGVPQRIKQLVPDAKFIYLVRDPVARTISHHQHLVALGEERRSLESALSDLSEAESLAETCMSLYAAQLQPYLDHFQQERIKIIDQADFARDRERVLAEVFAFLDVDETFWTPDFAEQLYQTRDRRRYPPGYQQLVGRRLAVHLRWVPQSVRRALRAVVERIAFPRLSEAAVDESLQDRLRALYAEDVKRLRELTGMPFASWSV
jgi:Sulfotransferase family